MRFMQVFAWAWENCLVHIENILSLGIPLGRSAGREVS